jgi:predicted DNA-binding transcriptional regulator AlpA
MAVTGQMRQFKGSIAMPRDESLTASTPHVASSDAPLLELLTVEDVAALFKVSKSWVYEHTRTRGAPRSERIPHVKIGKYVRFDPRLVRAFIDRRMAGRDRAGAGAATMTRELQHEEPARGKGFSR